MKKMLKRSACVALVLSQLVIQSCGVTEDIPNIEFFLNKEWKMTKVEVNKLPVTDDLSLYRLQLNDDFTFAETYFEGAEFSGNWQLDNNGTVLVLIRESGDQFKFIIANVGVRVLQLSVIQEDFKDGSLEIDYFLEPVRI